MPTSAICRERADRGRLLATVAFRTGRGRGATGYPALGPAFSPALARISRQRSAEGADSLAVSGSPSGRLDVLATTTGEKCAQGFTLLELLVVLVLVGLVTALAVPNLERLRTAVTRTTERDYILDQFAGLGRQAMLKGRAYVVFGTGGAQGVGLAEPARETVDAASEESRARPAGDSSGPTSHAGHERYVIDLPEGWEIRLDQPLIVRANGVCLGAGLTLYHQRAEDLRIDLDPPYCRIGPDA